MKVVGIRTKMRVYTSLLTISLLIQKNSDLIQSVLLRKSTILGQASSNQGWNNQNG